MADGTRWSIPAHGSNVILHRHFVWGVRPFAAAEHQLAFRAIWAHSATVPIETFAWPRNGSRHGVLDVCVDQMPKYP